MTSMLDIHMVSNWAAPPAKDSIANCLGTLTIRFDEPIHLAKNATTSS